MRPTDRYGDDVLAGNWRRKVVIPDVAAELGEVVEDAETGFTGEIVAVDKERVTLLGRGDRKRVFPLAHGAFLIDGKQVTLVRPVAAGPATPRRTASGSIAAPTSRAKIAKASRIYVEGKHDAELVERVWGDDLRDAGIVVEALDGIDDLANVVAEFAPTSQRRLGVLVDHLVPGSKESRIVATCATHTSSSSAIPTSTSGRRSNRPPSVSKRGQSSRAGKTGSKVSATHSASPIRRRCGAGSCGRSTSTPISKLHCSGRWSS